MPPTDTEYFKYQSEAFFQNGTKLWERNNKSFKQSNNYIGLFLIDDTVDLKVHRKIAEEFSSYGIFQPNTIILRGTAPDTSQTAPIGLNGGRLAEAIKTLTRCKNDEVFFGSLYMDDILDMIDWAADITIAAPKKSNINANIPTTRNVIAFTDRYMRETAPVYRIPMPVKGLYMFCLCSL